MATDIDVLKCLKLFVAKSYNGHVNYATFAAKLQRQAMAADKNIGLFQELAANPDLVLLPRLKKLESDQKVFLNTAGDIVESIVVLDFFVDLINKEYQKQEETPEIPFPNEKSLKIEIPSIWIKQMPIEDITSVMESGRTSNIFYRLIFLRDLPSIICSSDMLSSKLLELAALKIRHYLRQGTNKEYFQNKLLYIFQNREDLLRETMNTFMVHPFDSVNELREKTNDTLINFWNNLVMYIRKDLEQKPDKSQEDLMIIQAAHICSIYSNFYKRKIREAEDVDSALKTIATKIRESPYIFTMAEINDFKDAKQQPLSLKCRAGELEEFINRMTRKTQEGMLPEILTITTPDDKCYYLAKDRILILAVKYIGEVRQSLLNIIQKEWREVFIDLDSRPYIENDEEFREYLSELLERVSPILDTFIKEHWIEDVWYESRNSANIAMEIGHWFRRDRLVPLDELLGINRKHLVTDVKSMMPLMYSMPFLSFLAKLLRTIMRVRSKKKERVPEKENDSDITKKITATPAQAKKIEFSKAAEKVEKAYLPEGVSLEAQIKGLESRWNPLIDETAKKNLTEDIKALVKDYLRTMMRTMKPSEFTVDRVRNLTSSLADSPNLAQIRNRGALEDYMALYMVFLLKS